MSPRSTSPEFADAELADAIARSHAEYHRRSGEHRTPDGLVDDVVTHRMLGPHLVRAGLFLVAPTVLLAVWLVLDYLSSVSSPSAGAAMLQSVLGLLVVVGYGLGVAAFFAPATEPIAEHSRLVEGAGASAEDTTRWLRDAATARRFPAALDLTTTGGVPAVLVRQHAERALLLVQPYGADLYVGWTLWRSRSSATLLLHFLRDTFGRFVPGPRSSAALRAAATRALRESVHSLAREAAAVAAHRAAGLDGPADAAGPAAAGTERRGEPRSPRRGADLDPDPAPRALGAPDARSPGPWGAPAAGERVHATADDGAWGPPIR